MTQGELRERVWNNLSARRIATYPTPPHGHHPNFVGSAKATERLLAHPVYQRALAVMVGPDQVLKAVREDAMRSGRVLIMPHPDKSGQFLQLQGVQPQQLKRVRDVAYLGRPVLLSETAIDLVLVGCVAVDKQRGWIGKGYGFPNAQLQVAAPWATLAHPGMLFEKLAAPPERCLDLVFTPLETLALAV